MDFFVSKRRKNGKKGADMALAPLFGCAPWWRRKCRGEEEEKRDVPGKPNGGGGNGWPPMGPGPPWGASMGLAPAWPSAL